MNVRRFTARTSRDALGLVRQALGDDAVVLSTKPSEGGVEVLAMAPDGMRQIERMAASAAGSSSGSSSTPLPALAGAARAVEPSEPAAPPATPPKATLAQRSAARVDPRLSSPSVEEDVTKLAMSTLSFQDYVRDRMLKRRADAKAAEAARSAERVEPVVEAHPKLVALRPARHGAPRRTEPTLSDPARPTAVPAIAAAPLELADRPGRLEQRMAERAAAPTGPRAAPDLHDAAPPLDPLALRQPPRRHDAVRPAVDDIRLPAEPPASLPTPSVAPAATEQADMMAELRQVRGLIEERFGALAFMEKLNRQPGQARLTQKLLDCGYSPALIRKLGDSLPVDATDELAWAATVLERNLCTAEHESTLEDQGGVYALVGATGVGKTTTTAKIAAAFATKYGAANLGLITLDAYRVGAHEQLRAYGRILGVPVHTAHDRASLEDLLELLAGKKMVLIDTAGMAQRDTRTRELLEMLSHRSVQKLLVVNAASQGETIEDVLLSYRAAACRGIVLSKMDEAVKLGPALDALIRHKLKVIGVANGQRVPEDWHRLTATALVHRSLKSGGSSAYRLDSSDVSLIFTAPQQRSAVGLHG